jgi:hypothetical protein
MRVPSLEAAHERARDIRCQLDRRRPFAAKGVFANLTAGLNRRVEIEFVLALAAVVSRTIATCPAPSRRLMPARDSLFLDEVAIIARLRQPQTPPRR